MNKINKNHFFTQFAKDVLGMKVVVDDKNVCISVSDLKKRTKGDKKPHL